MPSVTQYQQDRGRMVESLSAQGIHDARVLSAISRVPRERFVEPKLADLAYEDKALPIERGQSISQPFVVALMTQSLGIRTGQRILEVGTGSGYQTAVLAELGTTVVTVERHAELWQAASRVLSDLGYRNVELHLGDGALGWPARAPFDRIIVTAGGPRVPPALLDQLAEGGRMIMPLGPPDGQQLTLIVRRGDQYDRTFLGPVRFVPLVEDDATVDR